ncbi:MAG: ribonuclease H family protein, partial [Vulcanimicrobiaceae bacterium]
WNTLVGRVFNCENKVKEVVNMCDNLLRVGKCSIRHLESLVGKLEWLARTMQFARCWKRSLLMELRAWKSLSRGMEEGLLEVRGQGSKEVDRSLGAASRRELKWWRRNAGGGIALRLEEVERTLIDCDASDYGFGATNGLWGLWKLEELNWNIAVKEMESLRRTVGRLDFGQSVTLRCDNQAVYWCMLRGRSFCWELNSLVRRIGGDAMARELDIKVIWIPTWQNEADGISRSWSRPALTQDSSRDCFV